MQIVTSSQDPQFYITKHLRVIYHECFIGLCTFKDYRYHVELHKNTTPVVHPVRENALALIPKLDKELDNMHAAGIIVPVD